MTTDQADALKATNADHQAAALLALLDAVVDAVKVAGTRGAPGGVLYSALMGHGVTYSQFVAIMAVLVRGGRVTQQGDLYFA